MDEQEILQEYWDKRKILIGIVLFALLAGVVYYFRPQFLDTVSQQVLEKLKRPYDVAGAKTTKESVRKPRFPEVEEVSSAVYKKVESLTQQVESLSVAEVASSSPQIQKVLNDLRSLQNLPNNKAKEACENICKQL